jgi:hypothetical protein
MNDRILLFAISIGFCCEPESATAFYLAFTRVMQGAKHPLPYSQDCGHVSIFDRTRQGVFGVATVVSD